MLMVAFAIATPGTAGASNDLYLIGFGTESAMMGGADVAVARATTALDGYFAGVRYSKPQAPLGVNAQERTRYPTFHAMLSRRW